MSSAVGHTRVEAAVESLEVSAYTIPTDFPESDGTLEWDSTTIVVVEVRGGGAEGLGYTYADTSVAELVRSKLTSVVEGRNALDVPAAWEAMVEAIRNLGRPGIASMAIAAVDIALWDLKARILDVPLATLLGRAHDCVPVYGSGGFTSYPLDRLAGQLSGWVSEGIPRVKIKVARDPAADPERMRVAREAIGDAELFIDANGALSRKRALAFAETAASFGVTWFEEPVSSDDIAGLRLLRDRAPAQIEIAAGEYGYDIPYFRRMLEAGAVDVLQADVTRCAGITELLRVGALCRANGIPFSGHTAPALHAHALCAVEPLAHLEYFHDHVRIEELFFDGRPELRDGALYPDLGRSGHGLEIRRGDVERFRA